MPRRLVPWLAAALLALVGAGLLVLAGLQATTLAPPATTTAQAAGLTGGAVVDSATGFLDGQAPTVRIEARSATPGAAVFVGVGRAQDVEAYLASAARVDVVGASGGRLTLATKGGEATLPDPAGADVWAAASRGVGGAAVVWPKTAGQWRFVAATDGSVPPAAVTITWTSPPRSSSAPALVAVGLVLLVGAVVLALVLRGRGAAGGPGDGLDVDDDDLDDDDLDVDDDGGDLDDGDLDDGDHAPAVRAPDLDPVARGDDPTADPAADPAAGPTRVTP